MENSIISFLQWKEADTAQRFFIREKKLQPQYRVTPKKENKIKKTEPIYFCLRFYMAETFVLSIPDY